MKLDELSWEFCGTALVWRCTLSMVLCGQCVTYMYDALFTLCN